MRGRPGCWLTLIVEVGNIMLLCRRARYYTQDSGPNHLCDKRKGLLDQLPRAPRRLRFHVASRRGGRRCVARTLLCNCNTVIISLRHTVHPSCTDCTEQPRMSVRLRLQSCTIPVTCMKAASKGLRPAQVFRMAHEGRFRIKQWCLFIFLQDVQHPQWSPSM